MEFTFTIKDLKISPYIKKSTKLKRLWDLLMNKEPQIRLNVEIIVETDNIKLHRPNDIFYDKYRNTWVILSIDKENKKFVAKSLDMTDNIGKMDVAQQTGLFLFEGF